MASWELDGVGWGVRGRDGNGGGKKSEGGIRIFDTRFISSQRFGLNFFFFRRVKIAQKWAKRDEKY